MMIKNILILLVFLIGNSIVAQQDPVLFTVEGKPVLVSEFDYIYSKNSGKDTDYSEKSLQEYLDLYVKFKLKVQRAKELKMDTIPTLKKELAGYRKQLAKSYLTDKEITNRLIEEVYNRSDRDIKIAHILFNLPKEPNTAQVKDATEKANKVLMEIKGGLSFEDAVKKYSQDKISANNGGSIGFLTAMFPSGFYELENAAYATKKGEISEPFQTKLGVHILKVEDVRKARGEMEVSHILIRNKSQRKVQSNAKELIDSIYLKLEGGADFAELARKYSQDKSSASNGGYIGYFGINRFENRFEDGAFEIANDGEYSKPIETTVGYHILKRISLKTPPSYEDAKKILKSKVVKNPRHKQASLSLISRIKTDSDFKEDKEALAAFAKGLDKTFYSYKWKVPVMETITLFNFGKKQYTLSDFATFAKNNTRSRLRMDELPTDEAIARLYKEYVDDSAISYEEKQLEKKYPDFKAIMREYEEGILLFEVTKMNVWDKSSKDTTGLKAFYENNKSQYIWKDRATVKTYIIKSTDEKLIKKFSKKAKKKSPEWLKNKFGDIFTYTEGVYERGSREVSGLKFVKNGISSPILDTRKGTAKVKKIDSIIPPALKTLKDARGYIEADYQDQLEKEWIAELKKKYTVVINKGVLQSLIK